MSNQKPSEFEGHTPGPWRTYGSFVTAPYQPGSPSVAEAYPTPQHGHSKYTSAANVKLLAAAPTLLRQRDELVEALREIVVLAESDAIASIEALAVKTLAAVEGK